MCFDLPPLLHPGLDPRPCSLYPLPWVNPLAVMSFFLRQGHAYKEEREELEDALARSKCFLEVRL